MSYQQRLTQWASMWERDLALAKLGVVLSVLLLGMRLLAAQVLLVVIPLATGTACLTYVLIHGNSHRPMTVGHLPRVPAGYLPSLVVFALAALVLLTRAVGSRTWPVYLLTAGIGTVILGQILLVDDEELSPASILAQVLLAAVVIRLSALYVTPGFVGNDIWTHIPVFIEGIVSDGTFRPIAESKYLMAPLYHSIGAVAALVYGDARVGVYLTMGLLIPLSALLIYNTAGLFIPTRWALLATALFAFGDQFIRWGLHIIPTSLGLVFFLAALYCLSRLFVVSDSWSRWLLLCFSLGVVFTHQVSTTILLLVLGIATAVAVLRWASGVPEDEPSPPASSLLAVFTVTLLLTVFSWANTPWSGGSVFLPRMLSIFSERVKEAAFLDLASQGGVSVLVERDRGRFAALIPYVELVGFALLLAGTVVGGLRMLRWDRATSLSLTLLLSAIAMFVIAYGMSLFGLRVLLPGRWLAFLYAPMAIVAAVGAGHLARNGSSRLVLAAFLVLAVCYPAAMVVTEKATLDSPAFEEEHPRLAYTEAEIGAVGTISAVRPATEDLTVFSDHPYQKLYDRIGGYDARPVALGAEGAVSPGPIVYREYQSTGPVSFDPPPDAVSSVEVGVVTESTVCQPGRDVVYANDEVRLCSPSSVTTGVESP